jgi:hypothetical protein
MKLLNLTNWLHSLVGFFTFQLGGGGGGSQTSTGTTYTSNIPEYAKPFYEQAMVESAKNVFNTDSTGAVTGVKGMPTYTGERVAGFTPGQVGVQGQIAGLTQPGGFATANTGLGTGSSLGYGTAGAGLSKALGYTPTSVYGGTFTPGMASYYGDPYQQQVTDIALREGRRQGDIAKQQGAMGAIGRGTFGGARQALMQAEQERGLQQNLSDIQAKGSQAGFQSAQQQFNADAARQLQAQQANQQAQQGAAQLASQTGLGGLTAGLEASHQQAVTAAAQQTSNLERLKAQAASEGEKQALQQKIDDLQYQTAMEQRDWEKKQLEFYNAMLHGTAGLAQTQVNYAPQPSGIQQALGGGLGLLGLSKALG